MCKIVLKSANEIRFIREIKFLNHLLDGALCINFLMIFYCFFSGFSITILPMLQLQTQQMMTSQIMSHLKYLIQPHNILVLILYSKLMKKVTALAI